MKERKGNARIYSGTKKVNELFDKITSNTLKKHGFLNFKIVSDWHLIIGANLARYTVPLRIDFPHEQTSGGVLYIACSNPGFSLEIQASEGQILGKLSTYFGYKAISRIRVIIDKNAERMPDKIPHIDRQKIEENDFQEMQKQIESISDHNLKASLNELFITLFEKDKQS